MHYLFALTIFTSAVLLFWLQPLFSKTILPLLGGSPSVWNTCMLFYQSALLVGYAYTHYSTKYVCPIRQAVFHLLLLLAAVLFLPLPTTERFPTPNLDTPIYWLLLQMGITIGLPLFVLSSNAPLIQSWYSKIQDNHSRDPYFLYAASNTGTLAVLLAFPFVIEPLFGIHLQTKLWSIFYIVFCALMIACVIVLWIKRKTNNPVMETETDEPDENDIEPPTWRQKLEWILWAFIPSGLLLGLTQYLTTDVASVPFLWVIPLAIYMATFAIVFSRQPIISHNMIRTVQPFILIPPLATIIAGTGMFFWIDLFAHLPAFFIHCMFCHGELARRRPHPRYLTAYFFCLAFGGVLGSVFVTLIAPQIFLSVLEYPLLLTAMILVCWRWNPVSKTMPQTGTVALLLGLLFLSVCLATGWISFISSSGVLALVMVSTLIGPAILRNLQQSMPVRIAFLLIIIAGFYFTRPAKTGLYRSRDFFGAYRVVHNQKWDQNVLYVGTTIHGAQFRGPDLRDYPVGYFDPQGAVGDIFAIFHTAFPNANFAVFGLGVGTLAAYGQDEQTITYYEINPTVYDIAAESGYFTYLQDSQADINVIFGDARLTISNAEDHSYDMIVLDAFNSDSVPVHLLTLEAFKLYQSKLKSNGWIAVQISNRFLDLKPVISSVVDHYGWTALLHDETLTSDTQRNNRMSASWIVILQDDNFKDAFIELGVWKPLPEYETFSPWTDNYSNIISILKTPDDEL